MIKTVLCVSNYLVQDKENSQIQFFEYFDLKDSQSDD